MAANVGVNITANNNTKPGINAAYTDFVSFSTQIQKYTNIGIQLNSRSFTDGLERLKANMRSFLDQYNSLKLKYNEKDGKGGTITKTLDVGSMISEDMTKDELKKVRGLVSAVRKKMDDNNSEMARDFLAKSQALQSSWTRANTRAEKEAIINPAKHQEEEAAKLAERRVAAEARINTIQGRINRNLSESSSRSENLYHDVVRRHTLESLIAADIRRQAEEYRKLGDEKAASAKEDQAKKHEDISSELAQRLETWTGNDKNIIGNWKDTSDLRRQLNSIGRQFTNNADKEKILSMKIKIDGWDDVVAKFREAEKLVGKTFTLGKRKLTFNGIEDVIKNLNAINKAAERGNTRAKTMLSNLTGYQQAWVNVANKYQQAKNKEVEQMRRQQKEAEKMNSTLLKQGNIFGSLARMASRYFSIYTIINFAKKIAETTGYFQQQQVALEGILGSATKAREVLSNIKAFAVQSPFQTKELVTFTKQLSAFGVDADDLFPTVKRLADISAGLGVDMNRIILAYGQVKSASVLRGQELRQFTEAGIPMVEKLAEKFTELNGTLVTTGDVFKLISERRVSFEMVDEVLKDMTNEGGQFYKMQENLTNTLKGQMSKLQDMWTLAMDSMGKSSGGLFMGVVKGLQTILKNAKALGAALITAFSAYNLTRFVQRFGTIVRLMKTAKMMSLAIASGIAAIASAIAFVWTSASEKANKISGIISDVESTFNAELKKSLDGLDSLVGRFRKAEFGTKEFNDALSALKSNYGDFVNDEIIENLRQQEDGWREIVGQIKEAATQLSNFNKANEIANEVGKAAVDDLKEGTANWVPFKKETTKLEEIISDLSTRNVYATGPGGSLPSSLRTDKTSDKFGGDAALARNYYSALESFVQNQGLTIEDFENELKETGNFKDEDIKSIRKFTQKIFEVFQKSEGGAEYFKRLEEIRKSDYYAIEKAFRDGLNTFDKNTSQNTWDNIIASKGLNRKDVSTTEVNDVSKEYNPARYREQRNETVRGIVRSLLFGYSRSGVPEVGLVSEQQYSDARIQFQGLFDVLENGDYDGSKILTAFKELLDVVTDQETRQKIIHIRDLFLNSADIVSGRAKEVTDNIDKVLDGAASKQKKDYYKRWVANDKNYNEQRDAVLAEEARLTKLRKEEKRATGEQAKQYDEWGKQLEWIQHIRRDIYHLNDPSKQSGSRSGGWQSFFGSMFSVIKEAMAEQKKLSEGGAGEGSTLAEEVFKTNSKLLKSFFTEGGNPFQSVIDEFKEYGEDLSSVFKATDFDDITTELQNETPDYEAIWKKLSDVIAKKIDEVRAKGDESLASRLSAYLQDRTVELQKILGKNGIQGELDRMLNELKDISNNTKKEVRINDIIDNLSKTGRYTDIARAITGRAYESPYNLDTYWDQLNNTFTTTTGKALLSKSPMIQRSFDLLSNTVGMQLENIPHLLDILSELDKISAEDPVNGKPFKDVKDKFVSVLEDLIKAIIEAKKDLDAAQTRNEKLAVKFYEAERAYKNGIQAIDFDDTNADQISTELRQNYVKSMTEILGGVFSDEIAHFTQEFSSETGSSMLGNFLQGVFSLQNGGLKGLVANILADKVANGMDKDAAAGQFSSFGSGMAIAEMIIKGIDSIVKLMDQIVDDIEKASKSKTNVKVRFDQESGAMSADNLAQQQYWESVKASIGVIDAMNQSLQSGFNNLKSGNILGAAWDFTGGFITNMVQKVRELHDLKYEQEIQKLGKHIEFLQTQMEFLDKQANRMTGWDKVSTETSSANRNLQMASDSLKQYNLEQEKKGADADKMQEYYNNYKKYLEEYKDYIFEMKNELIGSVEDIAGRLSSAMREAFKSGENSARAWRDVAIEAIGDIVNKMLEMAYIQPMIQSAQEKLMGGTIDEITNLFANGGKMDYKGETYTSIDKFMQAVLGDDDAMREFLNDYKKGYESFQDGYNSMSKWRQEVWAYNSDKNSLGSGIESITEDTARVLEGIQNSMLVQIIQINAGVQALVAAGTGNSGNQNYAQLQVQTMTGILNETRVISRAISDMRLGISPLHVKMS